MIKQDLYRVKKRRISLTALIDVVFILLLFFMLTTSFSQWRAIPLSTANSTQTESHKDIDTLLLMPDETLINYTQNITYKTYQKIQLADLNLKNGDDELVLLPHQDVPLQLLLHVTQHLKTIGLSKVSFGHSFGDELNVTVDDRDAS